MKLDFLSQKLVVFFWFRFVHHNLYAVYTVHYTDMRSSIIPNRKSIKIFKELLIISGRCGNNYKIKVANRANINQKKKKKEKKYRIFRGKSKKFVKWGKSA